MSSPDIADCAQGRMLTDDEVDWVREHGLTHITMLRSLDVELPISRAERDELARRYGEILLRVQKTGSDLLRLAGRLINSYGAEPACEMHPFFLPSLARTWREIRSRRESAYMTRYRRILHRHDMMLGACVAEYERERKAIEYATRIDVDLADRRRALAMRALIDGCSRAHQLCSTSLSKAQ